VSERRYTVYQCEEGPPDDRRRSRRSGSGGRSGGNGRSGGRSGGNGRAAAPPGGAGGDDLGPRQVYARPRRRWVTVLRYVALALVAATCGIGGYAFGWLQSVAAEMNTDEKAKVVDPARQYLAEADSGEAVNILLMGSDRRRGDEADPGRSDTMMLMRLDPNTGMISLLSVPRDLYVEIPGYGSDRINVAYTVDGPKGAIRAFKQLTGLDIHYFMDIDFLGFVHVVDYLRGVYIDVDRRYYNPPGTGYAAIDIEAGYQLLKGRPALQFVRFRHDELGDFGRMVRQQVFLHEIERQVGRWDSRLPRIVKKVAEDTTSNIDSAGDLINLARMLVSLDTSQVYQAHVIGTPTMVDEKSVLLPNQAEIESAVAQFKNPAMNPSKQDDKITVPRDSYAVRVLNGSGAEGIAGKVAADLTDQGFRAVEDGNADTYDYDGSVVYATSGLKSPAQAVARLLKPCTVKIVNHLPGTLDGMTVVVGGDYSGQITAPDQSGNTVQQQAQQNVNMNQAEWQTWAAQVNIPLMMPTAWSSGMTYQLDQWRSYTIPTPDGKRAAFVAVGKTAGTGYWHVQATSWDDPPILQDPSESRTIDGTKYQLYYQNARLHRVAWRADGTVYWITNTLDDEIANKVLLTLATSCVKVE